jgi:6-phosphogluconate dehydrogenase
VVFDTHPQAALELAKAGAVPSRSLAELISKLDTPRVIWLMVPAAGVEATLGELTPLLGPGDTVIDGGNSYYHDDIRRAKTLGQVGMHFVDIGTSGGVWGFERGYCLMIGGEPAVVRELDGIFATLAPGLDATAKPHGDGDGTPQRGYVHCGPPGAGHFVKMVHNGIEYGIMAAYAEGLNILRHANAGHAERAADAETAPLRHPELYQYDLNLADIAEAWRHGSVIGSWLLDLTAAALKKSPDLSAFAGRVSDSGEGRWTLKAAIDEGVPAPVLSVALAQRFASRGDEDFADKVLSALRYQFGGHEEKR